MIVVEDGQIGLPWAHFVVELVSDYPRDLGDVIQVVHGPSGQKLSERHVAEIRMESFRIGVSPSFEDFSQCLDAGFT